MRKKLSEKTNNLPFMLKLFISFVLLTSIPIILVSIMSHVASLHYFKDELGKSYLQKLEVADAFFRLWDNETKKQAMIISLNNHLNQLDKKVPLSEITDNYDRIDILMKISKDLEILEGTSNKYYSILIYLEEAGYIISSRSGIIPFESYEDKSWLGEYRLIKSGEGKSFWRHSSILGDISNNSKVKDYVFTYITPLMPYVTAVKGAIIFNLYESELSGIINGSNNDGNENLFVIDENGTIISDVTKANLGKNMASESYMKKILSSQKDKDCFTTQIDGKKHLIAFRKSSLNNWIYCTQVSLDILSSRTSTIFLANITLAILLLSVTVFLSYVFSKKLYTPLGKVIFNLKHYQKVEIKEEKNELKQISEAFDNFVKLIDKNEEIVSENYLSKLLYGLFDKRMVDNSCYARFTMENFCCVIVYIDRYDHIINQFNLMQQHDLQLLVLELFQTRLEPLCLCEGVVLDNNGIVLILNSDPFDISALENAVMEIQSEILETSHFSISLGIGGIYEGLENISLSYQEAHKALSRRLILGYGSISIWCQEKEVPGEYYYPYALETYIFNSLRLNDTDKTFKALSDFIQDLQTKKNLSIDNIIQIFNQFAGNIIKYLMEIHINSREIFEDGSSLYQRLARLECIDEIHDFFKDVLKKIIVFTEEHGAFKKSHIKNIMTYIHLNYKKDIDLNTLAENIGLSYSHMRRIFTEETGDNILNYINKLRVDEAKKLLTDTHLGVGDIASRLGYYNKQSFYRFFKKFEGITPSEYRNLVVTKKSQGSESNQY